MRCVCLLTFSYLSRLLRSRISYQAGLAEARSFSFIDLFGVGQVSADSSARVISGSRAPFYDQPSKTHVPPPPQDLFTTETSIDTWSATQRSHCSLSAHIVSIQNVDHSCLYRVSLLGYRLVGWQAAMQECSGGSDSLLNHLWELCYRNYRADQCPNSTALFVFHITAASQQGPVLKEEIISNINMLPNPYVVNVLGFGLLVLPIQCVASSC
jgi:hypothetical protein